MTSAAGCHRGPGFPGVSRTGGASEWLASSKVRKNPKSDPARPWRPRGGTLIRRAASQERLQRPASTGSPPMCGESRRRRAATYRGGDGRSDLGRCTAWFGCDQLLARAATAPEAGWRAVEQADRLSGSLTAGGDIGGDVVAAEASEEAGKKAHGACYHACVWT
jgi:hypothetical protein